MSWKCPKCSHKNLPTNLACSNCGNASPAAMALGQPVIIARIGNVQGLVTLKGEGTMRQPYAKFLRMQTERPLDEFNMEEVAALHALTDQVLREAYQMQTIVVVERDEEKK